MEFDPRQSCGLDQHDTNPARRVISALNATATVPGILDLTSTAQDFGEDSIETMPLSEVVAELDRCSIEHRSGLDEIKTLLAEARRVSPGQNLRQAPGRLGSRAKVSGLGSTNVRPSISRKVADYLAKAVSQFLLGISGVDTGIIARCPDRDRSYAKLQGWLTILNWIYLTAAISFGLAILVDGSLGSTALDLILSMVIAGLVVGFDAVMMRAVWAWQGLSDLRKAGLKLRAASTPGIVKAIFIVVRLGMSFVFASLLSALLVLHLFREDITQTMRSEMMAMNRPIFALAERQVDQMIAAAQTAVDRESRRIASLNEQRQVLRASTIQDDDALQIQKTIEALSTQKTAAEADLAKARQMAANEADGGPGARIRGRGPAWAAYTQEAATANAKVKYLDSQLSAARAAMEAFQRQKDTELAENSVALADAVRTRSANDAQLSHLMMDRNAVVQEIARQNPQYAVTNQGLVGQFRSLDLLAQDTSIAWWLLLFKVAIIGLELTAILAKLLNPIRTTYALMIASADYVISPMRELGEIQKRQMETVASVETYAEQMNQALASVHRSEARRRSASEFALAPTQGPSPQPPRNRNYGT